MCKLNGDDFFVADDTEIMADLSERAAARGNTIDSENAVMLRGKGLIEIIASPSMSLRFRSFQHHYEAMKKSASSDNVVMLSDIDQNRDFTTSNRTWPSLATHACSWSFARGRPAVCLEHAFIHGYNVYPDATKQAASQYKDLLSRLPHRSVRHVIGNGQHIAVMQAWVLYVLSNIAYGHPNLFQSHPELFGVGRR